MPFLQILGFLGQEMQKGIVVISVPTVYEAASRPFVAALVQKKKAHLNEFTSCLFSCVLTPGGIVTSEIKKNI
jgi:hypothetical protein